MWNENGKMSSDDNDIDDDENDEKNNDAKYEIDHSFIA